MIKSLTLIACVVGAYLMLRGWEDAPLLPWRACFALVILLAGLMYWGCQRNKSQMKMLSLRHAGGLDRLLFVVGVVCVVAFFVVIVSIGALPSQKFASKVELVLAGVVGDQESEGQASGEAVDFSGRGSGDWLFDNHYGRALPKSSNHKPGNQIELFLELKNESDSEALLNSRLHVHSFSFSNFDGVSWSTESNLQEELIAPIEFDESRSEAGKLIEYRIYHGSNPTGQNIFTSLQGVRDTDLESLTRISESIYRLPDLKGLSAGYTYTSRSAPVHLTDLLGEKLDAASGKKVELEIPEIISARILETSDLFKHKTELSEQLEAIRQFLRGNYQYSLDTVNDRELNPLENFLYEEKRGYCEHFASAAAMLCRALGVPSRVAYGWSGGRLFRTQNMFVFRGKDAHAWTEIKLDGYGWVVFDTTPADDDDIPESQVALDGEVAPNPQEVIAERYQHFQGADGGRAASLKINPYPLMVTLFVLTVCGACVLLLRVYRQPETDHEGNVVLRPAAAYFQHFQQVCAGRGVPMPSGRTLRQQVDLLQQIGDAPEFLQSLLEYHYGLLYGAMKQDRSIEKELVRKMNQWGKEHHE